MPGTGSDSLPPFLKDDNGNPAGSQSTGYLYPGDGYATNYQSFSNDLLGSLQINDSPEEALQWIKENNPELYYQLLLDRDNNRLEWERYRDYQRDYYSLMKTSLENAGMNPWLALQNFGSIGTGSVGSISTGSATNTLKAQREAKNAELAGKGIGALGSIIGAIIGALIVSML